ncbi:MAG: radical SAM protein [Candidatus Omnitrophota bacterium]
MAPMIINKVFSKSILNKSGITDYAVNCYVGCQHNCVYCYARFMKKFTHHKEKWGTFVDVKINAAEVLENQLQKINCSKEVMMSSVCDGWQQQEEHFKLSRKCLELLLKASKSTVSILTKNALIKRDFDIVENFRDRVNIGCTITTVDEALRTLIEPCSSTTDERFGILREAAQRRLKTYVFIGPLIPGFSDIKENLHSIFKTLSSLNVSKIYVDKLNYFNPFRRNPRSLDRG